MRFYQDDQPPLVWDAKLQKVTIIFQDGVFEADEKQAELLERAGYRCAEPEPESMIGPEEAPAIYAVMKEGRERAVKLFNSQKEAQATVDDLGEGYYIEPRTSGRKR